MLLNDIDFDRAERKICRDCVEELRGRGNSETLKKVGDRIVYGTEESEEDKEEVQGEVIGGGSDEVSFMPVVYPRGTVSFSSLDYFLSVGSSSKPSHPPLPLSLGVRLIQEYPKKKRGRKRKYIKPQEEKARREQQMKKMSVTVREKLVVGYWDLVRMESGADNSSEQDIATVTKELEEPSAKRNRNLLCKEENLPRLKKYLGRLRNPAVNGVCDADCLELGKDTVP